MKNEPEFPVELLSQDRKTRYEYFEKKVIAHPKLITAYRELLRLINQRPPGSLIFVVGPTGVGKTTLIGRFIQNLLKTYASEMKSDPSYLPVFSMEVAVVDTNNFGWLDYYRRALITLKDPFVGHKVSPGEISQQISHALSARERSTSLYRWALEESLRQLKPKIWIDDEGQHFKNIPTGRGMLNHMDTLKSLASSTKVTRVMFGTYELIVDGLSGQLDRRSETINFPRYRFDIPQELNDFKKIIGTFQRNLPLRVQPDLISQIDFLYERTLGCVGLLKEWLNAALQEALDKDNETITMAMLESQSVSKRKLINMAREIREGEAKLRDDGKSSELRSLLTMSSTAVVPPVIIKKKKKWNYRPGLRKPGRDKVGIDESITQ